MIVELRKSQAGKKRSPEPLPPIAAQKGLPRHDQREYVGAHYVGQAMEPIAAHRLWAATYDETPNPLLALEQRVVEPLLPSLRGAFAIDAACGSGRWARRLAAGGAQTIAVDLCSEMLLRAPAMRVLADVKALPVPDCAADLTICAFAMSYMEPCLYELARITRSGGTVIISDMHPAAAERGWTRSFRAGEEVIAIQTRPYTLESLRASGLMLDTMIESPLGEPERPLFQSAGKLAQFDEACRGPAIYVAKFIRQ
jgi:malonyl-CoA O-methyltransferase